jgi:Uncharacterised nucleotidyltransferase
MQREPERQQTEREQSLVVTLADGAMEAQRLVAVLQQQGISLRLLGGVAVQLRCPNAAHRTLNRSYADLDFVALKKHSRTVRECLSAEGYTADRQFNALHGDRRLLFYDEARSRQIDIFLSTFEMCHALPLAERLNLHPLTLSPADLLLTKLQIVQLNTKDIQDMLALLLDFEPKISSATPGDDLDVSTIARLCGQDWGWFATVNDNLDRLVAEAAQRLLTEESALITRRIEVIKRALQEVPKSVAWRLRAVAGRRIQWYELPEEVRR